MREPPPSPQQVLEEERQIALLRLPFALPPLLAFLDCFGPVAQPRLTAGIAAVYALYASLLVLALRRPRPPVAEAIQHARLGPVTVAADLVLATLLVQAIGSPALPPALIYLHAVFAAALRWGPPGTVTAALLGVGLGALALLHTPASRQIGVTALLLLTAALLGSRLCGIFVGREQSAVAGERNRIARDFHDDFIQALVATGLRLELCRLLLAEARGVRCETQSGEAEPLAVLDRELENLQALLNASLKEARGYLAAMRPARRPSMDLAADLERCAREIFRGEAVQTRVSVTPPGLQLAPETETAAYYIAREALFNARRHADPRRVVVSLEYRHDTVRMTVSDDGRGFHQDNGDLPPRATSAPESHQGLRTMRERAAAVGGTVQVCSAPGAGTTVIAAFPAGGATGRVLRARVDEQPGALRDAGGDD